jgi:DNA repair protein RecO
MSYQTYTTEAIICGTFNKNTADRSYLLFTKEAGVLYAEAKSVREERSRQRMALQDFSHVRVSLVKGKNSWKIGSIECLSNFFMGAEDKEARGSIVKVIKFLRRFYGGQEAAPALFEYMIDALTQLQKRQSLREYIELVVQVHLLHELGFADTRAVPPVAQQHILHVTEADATTEYRDAFIAIIERAIKTSHL